MKVKDMDLLDYFAAQALALMASPTDYPEHAKVAEHAYKVAEAMLAERKRRNEI